MNYREKEGKTAFRRNLQTVQKVAGLEAEVLLVIVINIIFNITENQHHGVNTLLYIKIEKSHTNFKRKKLDTKEYVLQ